MPFFFFFSFYFDRSFIENSRIKVRSDRATPTRTSKSKQRGFYDLTRAHTRESGSITRVEEFGLSSVSEEANVSDDMERPMSASPDSEKMSANDSIRLRGNLRRKTASSDDILKNKTRLQLPGSFSMDKLCSHVTENDEIKMKTPIPTSTPTPTAGTSDDAEASRDHIGKSGLIKRRMLGSIRGLMASTHLLQTYESDEVPCTLVASFSLLGSLTYIFVQLSHICDITIECDAHLES